MVLNATVQILAFVTFKIGPNIEQKLIAIAYVIRGFPGVSTQYKKITVQQNVGQTEKNLLSSDSNVYKSLCYKIELRI